MQRFFLFLLSRLFPKGTRVETVVDVSSRVEGIIEDWIINRAGKVAYSAAYSEVIPVGARVYTSSPWLLGKLLRTVNKVK